MRSENQTTPAYPRDYGIAARPDFIAALAAMLGVLVFDTLPGLFIGIGVAMLLLLYRASRPYVAELGHVGEERFEDLDRHPEAQPVPGVVVLRVESGLFFANADAVRARVLAAARQSGTKAVVIDAETIAFIDVSASQMLDGVAADLALDGVRLLLARDVGQVRDVLSRAGDPDGIEVYSSVREAARAASGSGWSKSE